MQLHPTLLRLRSAPLHARAGLLGLALTLGAHGAAQAGPEGETVVHGQAEFTRDGLLTTIQTSDQAIIDYTRFDVGADETVRFVQPDAASRVLNRVLGGDPSHIDGSLLANGQVYFLNAAGIFVGAHALIDVGGLYAAAGSLSNEDFLDGLDHFTELRGPVENLGEIQAERVHLIGQRVANHGSIVAHGGVVTLLAGDDVYLAESGGRVLIKLEGVAAGKIPGPGLEQSGEIDAGDGQVVLAAGDLYSLAIGRPGRTRGHDILLQSGDGGVVNVAGMLDASDRASDARGGEIRVLGDRIALAGATLDASGGAGGGAIRVGGDAHGQGELRRATATQVSPDSVLRADALTAGDGGRIVVWSDGVTGTYGTLSARGGIEGGDGGFVETSGRNRLAVGDLAPDLSAPAGRGGTWWIDPADLAIVDVDPGSGTPLGGSAPGFTVDGEVSFITDDVIEQALNAGTNVTLSTEFPTGTRSGNITQEAAARIEKSAGGAATLTLLAANDITLEGGVEVVTPPEPTGLTVGGLTLVLTADGVPGDDLAPGTGALTINESLQTGGGAVNLDAAQGIDVNAEIDTGGGGAFLGLASAPSALQIGGSVRTGGGDLIVGPATELDGSVGQDLDAGTGELNIVGSLTKTGAGDLRLTGGTTRIAGDVDVQQGSLTVSNGILSEAEGIQSIRASGNLQIGGFTQAASTDFVAGANLLFSGPANNKGVLARSLTAQTGRLDVSGVAVVSGGDILARDSITIEDGVTARSLTSTAGSINVGSDTASGTGDVTLLGGDLSAGRGIDVRGLVSVTSGSVTATSDIRIGDTLQTQRIESQRGDVIVGGFASIGGDVRAARRIELQDIAQIGGSVIATSRDVQIDGSATIGGSVSAGTGILVGDVTRVEGSLTASGGDIDVADRLTAGGEVRASGLISIGGDASATALDAGGALEVQGQASVDGDLRSGGDLTIDGDASAASLRAGPGGELTVDGVTTVTGDVSAGGDISLGELAPETIPNPVQVGGSITSTAGSITLQGDVVLVGLSAGSDIDVLGSATTQSAITAGESLTVEGDVNAPGLVAGALGDLTVEGVTTVSGDLSAGGDISLGESAPSEVPRPVNVAGSITSSAGSVALEGDVTLTALSAAQDVDVTGSLTVIESFQAGGDVTLDELTAIEDIRIDGLATVPGVVLSATGDVILNGEAEVVQIHAGRDVQLNGSGGSGIVIEGEAETEDDSSFGTVSAGRDLLVRGSLLSSRSLIAQRDFRVLGTLAVAVTDEVSAGGQIDVEGVLFANDVNAFGSDSDILVGGLILGERMNAGRDVSVSGRVGIDEALTAGRDIRISGSATVSGPLVAGEDVEIVASMPPLDGSTVPARTLDLNDVSAGANVTIDGDAQVSGDILAGGNLAMAAALELDGSSAQRLEAGAEGLSAVRPSSAGSLTAARIDKTGPGDLTLVAQDAELNGEVRVASGSLTVTGRSDVAATLSASGDLTLVGPTSVRADLSAGGVLRLEDAAQLGGEADQTVSAGETLVVQDVDKTGAGALDLVGASIELGSRVTAEGELRLRTTAPSSRPDRATLLRPDGDLELRSQSGAVILEPDATLIVGGNLEIVAPRVQLGDVSVDGALVVEAERIDLVAPRAVSPELGFVTKEGAQNLNVFGETIGFAASPTGSNVIFGTPQGRSGLTGNPLLGFDVLVTGGTIGTTGAPILQVTGAGIVERETLEPRPAPRPEGPVIVAQLAHVGAQRPLWSDELIAFLDCAGLGDCVPGAPTPATDPRVTRTELLRAALVYREVLQGFEALQRDLAQAFEAYRAQHPGEALAGVDFRRFVETHPRHRAALERMEALARLRGELDNLPLSPPQIDDAWLQLLERLELPGLELGELDQAIRPSGTELGHAPHAPRLSSEG
ncbi:MAG: filamentous hemagglutinin N-terminal domain-containing protein [Myxococcota bacterium]